MAMMKTRMLPAPTPGHRVRHVDLDEGGERVRAEGPCRPHVAWRDGLHHAVEREHHEREQDVVIAMIVPVRLWIIARRLSLLMRPTKTRRSLMTPCCWRSAIQQVVRTSSEVQNGAAP